MERESPQEVQSSRDGKEESENAEEREDVEVEEEPEDWRSWPLGDLWIEAEEVEMEFEEFAACKSTSERDRWTKSKEDCSSDTF
jgi:hypothetical protein